MTVQELIAILIHMPPDAVVRRYCDRIIHEVNIEYPDQIDDVPAIPFVTLY
jgi:hypothetical protein